jgi:citrate lyase beta subunit
MSAASDREIPQGRGARPIALTRSVLYLPASNPRAIEKARGLDADAVILDLEDAVAPDAKAEARQAAVAALTAGGFAGRLGVRINGLDTPWGTDDLAALAGLSPDFVVAPKIESPEAVRAVADHLPAEVDLWIMVETPLSVLRLDAIAGAGAPLAALMLGINDFGERMNLVLGPDREPLKPWLAAAFAAADAEGKGAIRVGYRMVERLHLDAAHRLLARHAAASTPSGLRPI